MIKFHTKNITIDKNNLFQIINLKYKVFFPLTNFMDKKNFLSVIKNFKLQNNTFFPYPIALNLKVKSKKKLDLINKFNVIYKNVKVCEIKNPSVYTFNKNERYNILKSLYNTTSSLHPGFKKYQKNNIYIGGSIINFNNKIIRQFNFDKPEKVKKKLIKLKKICGFHTRNIPHNGHIWVHNLGLKKCKNLLVQPIIGSYKFNEYSEHALIKGHKNYINIKKKILKKNQKIILSFLLLQPQYSGPREGMLHARIRKNYGCTHFLVGRDHAGYKNYFKSYATQKYCLKYEKKLGIKIISYKSPKYCINCFNITNNFCTFCKNKNLDDINGTMIRKLLKYKKKINNKLFDLNLLSGIKSKQLLNK